MPSEVRLRRHLRNVLGVMGSKGWGNSLLTLQKRQEGVEFPAIVEIKRKMPI
jgi:hypothetical protein